MVSTYFSRDHFNCHSKSLLNQKQKKGNKDSLVLIKGNRIQFLKPPNYYNCTPVLPLPPSGPMSKVILKYDQYQISPHNTTARSHAQVKRMSAMISAGEMSLMFELILSSTTNKKHMANSEENVHVDITGGLE